MGRVTPPGHLKSAWMQGRVVEVVAAVVSSMIFPDETLLKDLYITRRYSNIYINRYIFCHQAPRNLVN